MVYMNKMKMAHIFLVFIVNKKQKKVSPARCTEQSFQTQWKVDLMLTVSEKLTLKLNFDKWTMQLMSSRLGQMNPAKWTCAPHIPAIHQIPE